MPERPQLHFPSPYLLPTAHLAAARLMPMADGAQIAAFAYVPDAFARAADADLADAAAQMPDPVLMLHGNGEEHGIFGQVIDAVCASGRPVVAVDSRAQGKSTRGTEELTYELMADDALAALAALGFG
ncbi:MAG: alpha/beta hydrolase, partial [Parafannyhessea umbonata]|nr:alpha/beta hydrolase [Parafannyhessea umbonata]